MIWNVIYFFKLSLYCICTVTNQSATAECVCVCVCFCCSCVYCKYTCKISHDASWQISGALILPKGPKPVRSAPAGHSINLNILSVPLNIVDNSPLADWMSECVIYCVLLSSGQMNKRAGDINNHADSAIFTFLLLLPRDVSVSWRCYRLTRWTCTT